MKRATHWGTLRIGDVKLPCAVLEDGTRVLTQRGANDVLMNTTSGGDRLVQFLAGNQLKPYTDNALSLVQTYEIKSPSGPIAIAYSGDFIVAACEAISEAFLNGSLRSNQLGTAARAMRILSAAARVGMTALIDEATGYQAERPKTALQNQLDQILAELPENWQKEFPDSFYQELFRLRGLAGDPLYGKRPHCIAHWTNDFIYERLYPNVLTEIQERNPADCNYRRSFRNHQFLKDGAGKMMLRGHIAKVILLMQSSMTWEAFVNRLNSVLPKFGENMEFSADLDEVQVQGKPQR